MKNTAMVCLSSPSDTENHYSRMIKLVDKATGKPIFKVIQTKHICDNCLELPAAEAVACDHIQNTAPWINIRRARKWQAIYDDPALALREYGGVIKSNITSAFRKREIVDLFNRECTPTIVTTSTPFAIIITADNNGGGSSHMGLCSGYYHKDGTFVVRLLFIVAVAVIV